MSSIDYHKKLYEIISSERDLKIEFEYIEIPKPTPEFDKKLIGLAAETETLAGGVKRILTHSLHTKIFKNVEEFQKTQKSDSISDLIIFQNPPISFISDNTYINFELSTTDFLIKNAKSYLDFQDFLKRQEGETDDSFHFIDSYNKDLRKLTFVSLSDKGRLTIKYNPEIPSFDRSQDYSIGFEKFKECFQDETKNLSKFLKASLINSASNFESGVSFKHLFESLHDIVNKAKMNFEVYLNNLSIDKIKKDYDEVKTKYFSSLSEILTKLTNQIITLPIAISALLFTIKNIKEDNFSLIFLVCTIIATSLYLIALLRIFFRDLKYIEKIFVADYNSLLGNKFFELYPNEKTVFEEIKERITSRIRFLKLVIEGYFWTLIISNLIISAYILYLIGLPGQTIFIAALIVMTIVSYLRNNILERE